MTRARSLIVCPKSISLARSLTHCVKSVPLKPVNLLPAVFLYPKATKINTSKCKCQRLFSFTLRLCMGDLRLSHINCQEGGGDILTGVFNFQPFYLFVKLSWFSLCTMGRINTRIVCNAPTCILGCSELSHFIRKLILMFCHVC